MRFAPKLLAFAPLLLMAAVSFAKPHEVKLAKEGERWTMYMDGQPFYANGASTHMFYTEIAGFGANTIRKYTLRVRDKDRKFLDDVAAAGLILHAGLGFKQVRSGYYDENPEKAIGEQEEKLLGVVREFKDHPAILCWSIGNEVEIWNQEKPLLAQYESIQRIAAKIHEIDPNHPVTLAITEDITPAKIHGLMDICKDLDFLSCNCYIHPDGTFPMVDCLNRIGWTKPFISTELGPEGWWHHEKLGKRYTPWKAVHDYTSTEKEDKYAFCIEETIHDPRCVGMLSFVWGYQRSWRDEVKEWYGMLDRNMYTYGAVDVMQYYWTGKYPAKRAPRIESAYDIKLNGMRWDEYPVVEPGSANKASVKVKNVSGEKLRMHWRVVKEQTSNEDGSFHDGIPGLILKDGAKKVVFNAPAESGAYRLYIHVYDDVNRKAAYASIPFLVSGEAEALKDFGGRP